MTNPLNVVAVSGGFYKPSRTLVLTEALLEALSQQVPNESRVIQPGSLATHVGGALARQKLPECAPRSLGAVGQAELLVVASPVFRRSSPGLLKHLFDLAAANALIDAPVLLAATGGSDRHALILEH